MMTCTRTLWNQPGGLVCTRTDAHDTHAFECGSWVADRHGDAA